MNKQIFIQINDFAIVISFCCINMIIMFDLSGVFFGFLSSQNPTFLFFFSKCALDKHTCSSQTKRELLFKEFSSIVSRRWCNQLEAKESAWVLRPRNDQRKEEWSMQMNREWWRAKFKVEGSKAWTEWMTNKIDWYFKVSLSCSFIQNNRSNVICLRMQNVFPINFSQSDIKKSFFSIITELKITVAFFLFSWRQW